MIMMIYHLCNHRNEVILYRRKGNKPVRFIQYPTFWKNEDKATNKVWGASVS